MKNIRVWPVILVLIVVVLAWGTAFCEEKKPPKEDTNLRTMLAKQQRLDPGAGVMARKQGRVFVDGAPHTLRRQEGRHAGFFVPDGRYGYIWFDQEVPEPPESLEQARELRLRIRELADQLLGPSGDQELRGAIALPASFVNQDDFEQSSSFGRYLSEQMFYEFNQRGMPVREYRVFPEVFTRPREGEFVFTRNMENIPPQHSGSLFVTGTYYFDRDSVFVNARIFRALDKMVLRTASLVFAQNRLTRTMLAKGTGVRLETADMGIKSFREMKDKAGLAFMLTQEDLH
ncbi:MAG: FlgO family outer membrane protein [Thermodesulfobacteriota bacterium]|nr:FlgO family outer membrane protein [Thermodesulfobacteriota bacterium]